MAAELSLTVNGEPRRIAAGASIADLVQSLELDPLKVAVERNGGIVPRSTLAVVALADGDWRVYALTAHGRTIQVAQNMEVRRDRATNFALKTLSPRPTCSRRCPISSICYWG